MNTLIFGRQKCLKCFIKSINFKTNNKSTGNDGLTEEFYKHFQMN